MGDAETRDVYGFAVPSVSSDLHTDYKALLSGDAFLECPWERRVDLVGPDAASFLHQLVTQDIAGIEVGDSRPAAQADRTGHLRAELRVFRAAEDTLHIRLASPYVTEFIDTMEKHIIMEDVKVHVPFDEPAAFLRFASTEAEPPILDDRAKELGGSSMSVHETGAGDRLYFVPADEGPAFREALKEAAASEIGWDAFNRRRIECGRGWPGFDVDSERLVPEAGYEEHISYDKGCYLGQETLARLHYRGRPNWQLVRFQLSGEALPRAKADLLDENGERVGWLTSSARASDAIVALGYLHRRFRENPNELSSDDGRPVSWNPVSQ